MRFWKRGGYADDAEELLFRAWEVISNARADWINPPEADREWVKAAKKWRDDWNKHLRQAHPRLNSKPPEPKPKPKVGPGETVYRSRDLFGAREVHLGPPSWVTPTQIPTWNTTTTTTVPIKEIVIVFHDIGNGGVEVESPQLPGWRVVAVDLAEARKAAREAVADMYANGKLLLPETEN